MPYANYKETKAYSRKRYRAKRKELIKALGEKCSICGSTERLEVHHVEPYMKRSRPNSNEYFRPEGKELRCVIHHQHTESWRRKRRGRSV